MKRDDEKKIMALTKLRSFSCWAAFLQSCVVGEEKNFNKTNFLFCESKSFCAATVRKRKKLKKHA